jgi:hypothetical protein
LNLAGSQRVYALIAIVDLQHKPVRYVQPSESSADDDNVELFGGIHGRFSGVAITWAMHA